MRKTPPGSVAYSSASTASRKRRETLVSSQTRSSVNPQRSRSVLNALPNPVIVVRTVVADTCSIASSQNYLKGSTHVIDRWMPFLPGTLP
ncbi:hypothetical protein [Granulicella tundricola]|uniref:hypothetical protein n=1 Tax=Granulicella tundricola TaxID=940615 RepID=UPI0018DEB64A|nr:hypothetical protein [Granulicella tundricola]